jgi:hypothetical protein
LGLLSLPQIPALCEAHSQTVKTSLERLSRAGSNKLLSFIVRKVDMNDVDDDDILRFYNMFFVHE